MRSFAQVRVEPATAADAEDLRQVAVSAFAFDNGFKPDGAIPGGPPGHDALTRQLEWIRQWDYYKACIGERIVGGCIVKPRWDAEVMELFGLFVHRDHLGHGCGRHLLTAVMARYPDAAAWFLETPDYAERSRRFYERLGFRLQHKSPVDACLGFGFCVYIR